MTRHEIAEKKKCGTKLKFQELARIKWIKTAG